MSSTIRDEIPATINTPVREYTFNGTLNRRASQRSQEDHSLPTLFQTRDCSSQTPIQQLAHDSKEGLFIHDRVQRRLRRVDLESGR